MELSFSELRAKEVVNTQDGRKLGKVCDVVLCYPENRWVGIVAPNGSMFSKNGVFIEMKNIVKIGEDVVLVNVGLPKKHCGKKPACPPMHEQPSACAQNPSHIQPRNFEEFE
jgi:YlmC/YmxH family sporulation protein